MAKLSILALVAALALVVSSAHAAAVEPTSARIAAAADAAVPISTAAADAAPSAPAATAAVAAADKCEPLTQDVCGQTPGCVWCRCAAVPSSCFPEEQAKHLPPAVFQCDWPTKAAAPLR